MAAPPPQVVNLPADNTIARVGRPLVICAHDTEGTDSRSTLQHGDGRRVSVHCLIQKFPRHNGSTDVAPGLPLRTSGVVIYRMVPDERGANHAGFSTWRDPQTSKTYTPSGVNFNAVSLSFELECLGSIDLSDHYTDDQLLAAGYLINTWRAKFGPLPLVRHAEVDPQRRRDTFHLSTADLEKWANAAALVYQAARYYAVRGLPVYQRSDHTGPLWGYLAPGETVAIDDLSNGHLTDGRGFVDLNGLQVLP